jgi:hypothetical protein
MVPILYGGNFSTYTRLVLLTAYHYGLEEGVDFSYQVRAELSYSL